MRDTVSGLLSDLDPIGRDRLRGGFSRAVYTTPELDLREWFVAQAEHRGLDVHTDRNGAIWAWHQPAGVASRDDAILTGSHLDSVPGGGAFDGPLGVASALVAFDELVERGVRMRRPLAITVFPEEEGSRFGVACLGSRLLAGAINPERARSLTDSDGITFADAALANGLDPRHLGPDPDVMTGIRSFVELHVEQGRGLIDSGRPVGIATSILGHGRWRCSVTGEGNHAGTTLMADRHDPMLVAATVIVDVNGIARSVPGTRATVGRLQPIPGGTNVIASQVDFWLDIRHTDDAVTAAVLERIIARAEVRAAAEGCAVSFTEESVSPTVTFDGDLSERLSAVLPDAPHLPTGAGHDAGILAAALPTAMLFVRNPTGISHSPLEEIDQADAERGAVALADVLQALLTD